MRPATVGLNMTVADAQTAIPRDVARCMPHVSRLMGNADLLSTMGR